MKKILFAFAALALLSCEKDKKIEANLHIKGNVKDLRQGTLYIQKVVDTNLVAIDTIIIKGDSNFESHINLESPEMLYLFLDRGETNSIDNNLMFFAEPGNMTINTTLNNYFANAKITGSKNHKLYEEYKKVVARFNNSQLELTEEKIRALQFKREVPADNQSKSDNLMRKKYLYAINFALNNKDKEIAPYIALADVYDANIKYLDTINNAMTPKVAKSKYGKMLSEYITKIKSEEK